MSNYLSIAVTTAVFSQKILNALNKVQFLSAAPQVIHRRPEKDDGQMIGVNLYLYDIEFNHTMRNNDLATRRADGTLIKQPQVPLNLKYHLSFYGQDLTLEPQKMMGATIVELHAEPFITPDEIRQYQLSLGPDSLLLSSNLHTQQSRIKIEPIILSLEDVTKMWSSFFQLPHQHSLNYEVSVILMESDFAIEKPLPVHSVNDFAVAKIAPAIDFLSADYLPYSQLNASMLSLYTQGADRSSQVQFVEVGLMLAPISLINNVLQITLPAQLKVGLNHLRLSRKDRLGKEVKTIYSEPYPFIVQPVLGKVEYYASSTNIDEVFPVLIVDISPFPEYGQSVVVWLNNEDDNEQSYEVDDALTLLLTLNVDALNKGSLTELTEKLSPLGMILSAAARISIIEQSQRWLLQDGARYYTLHQQSDTQVLVCYGFEQLPSINALAFKAQGLSAGQYWVRVQIDHLKYGQSPLVQEVSDVNEGRYIAPRVTII